MTNVRILSSVAAMSAAGVLAPSVASAQSSPVVQVEDVVVTAQRREESLQSVPIPVSAYSAATLQAAGIRSTQDLSFVTPGFQIGQQLGAMILNIRGVGSQSGSAGTEGSVSTYVDGFYVSDARATIMELNNIERIEVLKGPQGTLFGRNAAGGLVQIVTRNPTYEPRLEASVGYGSYRTFTGTLYAATGITDSLAADIAVARTRQGDGFGTNFTTGRDTNRVRSWALRSKWVFEPNDMFSETFAVDYGKYASSIGVARRPVAGAFAFGGYTTPPGLDWHDITSNYDPVGRYEQWGVSSKTRVTLPWFDIVGLVQHRAGQGRESVDQDGAPVAAVNAEQHTSARYSTAELQFVSNQDKPYEWILGAFYMTSLSGFDPLAIRSLAIPSQNYNQFAKVDTESYAFFGQASVDIGWNTRFTAGLRYTHDRLALRGVRLNLAGLPVLTIPPTVRNPFPSQKITWRFALDHQFTDDIMGFVSYSRGFKSGVYSPTALNNPPVLPETIDASEIGVKSSLFDRTVRLNASVFHYRWQNIQLSQNVPGGSFLTNAALGENYGVEAEIDVRPTSNLTLHGAVSLVKTEFLRYPGGPCFRGPNPAGGDIPEPLPPAGRATTAPGVCELAGNRFPRTPKATLNLGFDYKIPMTKGEATLSASYYHNSGFFWEGENRLRQPSYSLVNGQATWAPTNGDWKLRVWGRNLFDEKYHVFVASNGTFGDLGSAAPPRTFGVAIDFTLD